MENQEIKVTARCPIRTTLEMLGGKWKLLIIQQLATEAKRLSILKKDIPDVSEKMLIQELKNLSDSGLIERINYGEVPPRVEYKLTEKGKFALPLIGHLKEFSDNYLKSI
jgi:DNA-binding HxlR family transcriptional regulator